MLRRALIAGSAIVLLACIGMVALGAGGLTTLFVWLAVQIELARGAQPEAGNGRKPGKRYSY